ncbi:MAG: type II toxin-antitoxin system VapC family toxin [Pyrinomonadaceae bacterium]
MHKGATLHITGQNVIEFWNVLTRPVANNGFGMSPAQADAEAGQLETFFPFLMDTPAIYIHWRRLVVSAGVSGVQVHDTRLVAVMLAHGITNLLTFNSTDFNRFSGITVVHPKDV